MPLKWLKFKRIVIIQCQRDVECLGSYVAAVAALENNLTVQQKVKHLVTRPSHFSDRCPRETKMYVQANTYSQMFIAALLTIDQNWK